MCPGRRYPVGSVGKPRPDEVVAASDDLAVVNPTGIDRHRLCVLRGARDPRGPSERNVPGVAGAGNLRESTGRCHGLQPDGCRNCYDEGGLISTSVRSPSTTIASSSVNAQCATPSAR